MSIQAIDFVFKQQMQSSHLKFVLLCFANYADQYGQAWCSNDTLQRLTCMNEKTIGKWVRKLETDGFLSDTGKRQGDTGRIKVYKIVSFETHPKLAVLENESNTPKNGGVNTPKIGESPTPPIKNNLKSKPKEKIYNKKSPKVSLAEWETKVGSQLCVEMMSAWIKAARANPDVLRPLVVEFRDKVAAGGNVYADFTAAFRVWLRNGWLSKPLSAIQVSGLRQATAEVTFQNPGTQL